LKARLAGNRWHPFTMDSFGYQGGAQRW
jgi:hypothetical protein